MVGKPLVSVLVVTFDSEKHLAECFESIRRQDNPALEVIIIDNASSDGTRELLANAGSWKVILNQENRGFAAAQNQAIGLAKGDWLLCLNPDVFLQPDFISKLVAVGDTDLKIGVVCGKLLRWTPGAQPERSSFIDSTGMYFQPNLRHLDRGAEEQDTGQYGRTEYIIGASGAAALYRRAMVEDVPVEGEFFDEEFFAYREDADLAWRAQLMGWRCLYTPEAVAWHERRVTPERRSRLPHEINWHSVKNRFLMRAKNISWGLYARCFLPATGRDLLILGYALLRDWRMFSALFYPIRHWRNVVKKRRWIQSRRRVSDAELAHWFRWKPVSEPVKAD